MSMRSIGADLDRSRNVSVRSRFGLDWNGKQVQSEGLDMRTERQYWQTCVALTKSHSLVWYSRTFDKISGGSLLTGTYVFLIALTVRKTPERLRSMAKTCELEGGEWRVKSGLRDIEPSAVADHAGLW